jgi:hypothetical protein
MVSSTTISKLKNTDTVRCHFSTDRTCRLPYLPWSSQQREALVAYTRRTRPSEEASGCSRHCTKPEAELVNNQAHSAAMGVLHGPSVLHVLSVVLVPSRTDGALAQGPGCEVSQLLRAPDQYDPNRCAGCLGSGSVARHIALHGVPTVEHLLDCTGHIPHREHFAPCLGHTQGPSL